MTDIEAIRQDWEHFARTVKSITPGDVDTFRAVNQTLGYNVAQTVPTLVGEINFQHLQLGVYAQLTSKLNSELAELVEEKRKRLALGRIE